MTPIRVLIVDDSAFARKVLREVLVRDPQIEVVGIARDGLDALEKIAQLQPDVVTLDLIMPELDGIGLLRALRGRAQKPRAVVVTVSGSDTELALEALSLGAVDLVHKPTALATDRLYEMSGELIFKVKAAYQARPIVLHEATKEVPFKFGSLSPSSTVSSVRLVVVGTSTGGPQALTELLTRLPSDFPVPVAIALHIPAGYTAALAERISAGGGLKLVEAVDGQILRAGEAVIAPGGSHLRIRRVAENLLAEVSSEPAHSLHHPSVDELFTSAAGATGAATVGVIMTGMGDDGTQGAGAIHRAGGRVLAESSESAVVYGMPRSVVEAGFAFGQASLLRLPQMFDGVNLSSNVRKIMIIEDDLDIRELLQEYLESEGHEVQAYDNGRLALDKLRSTLPPDVILLDWRMPLMSGRDFLEEYKVQAGPQVPIYLFSAESDPRIFEGLECAGVLAKPLNFPKLLAMLESLGTSAI